MNQDIQADEVEYGTPKHDNPNQFMPYFIMGLLTGLFFVSMFIPATIKYCTL